MRTFRILSSLTERENVGLSEARRAAVVGERRLEGVLYLLVGENSFTMRGQTRSVSNWLKSLSCRERERERERETFEPYVLIHVYVVWKEFHST